MLSPLSPLKKNNLPPPPVTSCSFLGQGEAFPSIALITTEALCRLLYREPLRAIQGLAGISLEGRNMALLEDQINILCLISTGK